MRDNGRGRWLVTYRAARCRQDNGIFLSWFCPTCTINIYFSSTSGLLFPSKKLYFHPWATFTRILMCKKGDFRIDKFRKSTTNFSSSLSDPWYPMYCFGFLLLLYLSFQLPGRNLLFLRQRGPRLSFPRQNLVEVSLQLKSMCGFWGVSSLYECILLAKNALAANNKSSISSGIVVR